MTASTVIEPYYTDAQVALMIDPTGLRITARSIRSERENGKLAGTRIAGKWLYAESEVKAFLKRVTQACQDAPQVPVSGQEKSQDMAAPSIPSSGPREVEPAKSRPVSATLAQLKRGSRNGSAKDDAPASPAQVIRLR